MEHNGSILLLAVVSYLAGSIPTGKIVGRLQGVDIQKKGSGNIGFANAVRVLGWPSGIVVLAVDVLKGFIPIYIARTLFDLSTHQLILLAPAPIIGHVFPVWLRFKGGKGIATGLGVTAALNPLVALLVLVIYLLDFAKFKKSAIASLTAASSAPVFFLVFDNTYFWLYIFLAAAAFYTHRTNISRLLWGRRHGAA